MTWPPEENYIIIACPTCNGNSMIPHLSGNGSWQECPTCTGLRMVRVKETTLNVYNPFEEIEEIDDDGT